MADQPDVTREMIEAGLDALAKGWSEWPWGWGPEGVGARVLADIYRAMAVVRPADAVGHLLVDPYPGETITVVPGSEPVASTRCTVAPGALLIDPFDLPVSPNFRVILPADRR